MKGGIGNIMKQAQEMQANMEKVKKELAKTEVIGRSGGDMIKITMNGKHLVNRVEIDKNAIKDDKEILEDLIVVAINDAIQKVDDISKEKMGSVTGGMNVPGLF